jgi:hypothetical protein
LTTQPSPFIPHPSSIPHPLAIGFTTGHNSQL